MICDNLIIRLSTVIASRLARSNTATYIYYDERLCLAR